MIDGLTPSIYPFIYPVHQNIVNSRRAKRS